MNVRPSANVIVTPPDAIADVPAQTQLPRTPRLARAALGATVLAALVDCGGGGLVEKQSVVRVTISSSTSTIQVGMTAPFFATVQVSGGASQAVTWASRDPAKATVNSSTGVVTGVTVGDVWIVATAAYDATKADSVRTTITAAPVLVSSVEIRPPAPVFGYQLGVGTKLQLSAIPRDAQWNALTARGPASWTSSNSGVATVSTTGEVTAVAQGTTSITVTVENVTSPALTTNVGGATDPCNLRLHSLGTTSADQFTSAGCRQHNYMYTVTQQTAILVRLTALDAQLELIPILARTNASLPATVTTSAAWNVLLAPGAWVTALTGPATGGPGRYQLTTTLNATGTCGASTFYATPGVTNGAYTLLPTGCAELRIYTTAPPGKTVRVRVNSTAFNPLIEIRVPATDAVLGTSAGDAAGPNAAASFTATSDGATVFIAVKSRPAGGSGAFTITIDP